MTKKSAVFIGIAAFLALLFTGCGAPQGSGSVTVEGTLIDPCGQPQPYTTVYIPGQEPALSDAEGHFTFTDVASPYDLVVAGAHLLNDRPSRISVLVYQGLTRTDPVIVAATDRHTLAGCERMSVSGSIEPVRDSAAYRNGVGIVAGQAAAGGNFAYDADPAYELSLAYEPGVSKASLFAMQWRRDTSNWDAVEYLGYTRRQITLDGEELTQDLNLSTPMGSRPVRVTLAAGAPLPLESIGQFVSVDGENLNIRTSRMYPPEAENGVYNFVAPVADGVQPLMVARTYYGSEVEAGSVGGRSLEGVGAEILFWKRAAADEDSIEMTMPDPVVPIAPLAGSQLIDFEGARFSWAGPEGAVYDSIFDLGRTGYSIEVVTASTSIEIPNLRDVGLAYRNDRIDRVRWRIYALGGEGAPTSVDEVAEGSSRAFVFDFERGVPHTPVGFFIKLDAGRLLIGQPGDK